MADPGARRLGVIVEAAQIDGPGPPNINGPALIRAPSWPGRTLGAYYLYFSHHRGNAIRLAVSDALEGPWRVHPDPVLTIAETHYTDHIASPDVIAEAESGEIRMYFHGGHGTDLSAQTESVAVSEDGLRFRMRCRDIGVPYWRVFRHGGRWYALVMPGTIVRSDDGFGGFEPIAEILPARTRHSAVAVVGSRGLVFCSMIGDRPERILAGAIDLANWQISNLRTVLAPAEPYEGGRLPLLGSAPGQCDVPARELRDPAVHVEGGTLYLAYAAGGERCLALAAMPLLKEWQN
ncbi:MAG: hypothetical protein ACREFJ_05650 [Acetobacteraceae bacterium]